MADARTLRPAGLGVIVYLLRHARAGKRSDWDGDDRLRPLDARGRRQAEGLVDQLGARELERVVSSPYARCTQTVEPLARAVSLAVETDDALAEGAGADAALLLFRRSHGPVVACVHGDLCEELLGEKVRKGATVVLELDADGGLRALERLDPPA